MIAHARPRRPGTGARTGRKPADRRSAAPVSKAADRAPQPLTTSQRRYLRGLCHDLKPLLQLGNHGVTPEVTAELERTIDHHELVKIRLSGGDRAERQQQLDALLAATHAELVQQIGHVASLYRRNRDKPRLALPA